MTLRLALGIACLTYAAVIAVRNLSHRGPRRPIGVGEWLPDGWLFLVSVIGLALLMGGGDVLFAPHQKGRFGGALALIAGAAVVGLVVQYVRRPVRETEPPSRDESFVTLEDARLPPFPLKLHGYDRDEVNTFFADIWSKQASEISAVRFRTRWRGYDLQAVDRALNGWSLRQSDPPTSSSSAGVDTTR